MIRFALNLKYLSSNAVGNFLALPSKRRLCDYTHVMSVEAGVSSNMIHRMKDDMNFEACSEPEKIVGVMLDGDEDKKWISFR